MESINSVSEYLEYLSRIKRIYNLTHTVSSFTFFRGQANANWRISPSLYRQGLLECENVLLTEIKHLCPTEMPENRFDALVKMQHYGMPTRLLDTTTNPLVALYFACENSAERDHDGAVYIFPNLPVSWSSDPLVELIMDFVFDYSSKGVCLDEMLKHTKEKYANAARRLIPKDIKSLLDYLTIPAFAVMPAKTNERIEAQDGAFYVFGMSLHNGKIRNKSGDEYYDFEPVHIESVQKLWHMADTLTIPASAKNAILDELDMLGINERKLFPDLSHQVAYAVNTVIKNRFR